MDLLSIEANLDDFELDEEAMDTKTLLIDGKQMLWSLKLRKTTFPGIKKGFFDVSLQARCPTNVIWAAKVKVITEVICEDGSYKIPCIDCKTTYSNISYMAHMRLPDKVDYGEEIEPEQLSGQIELSVGIDVKELLLGTPEVFFCSPEQLTSTMLPLEILMEVANFLPSSQYPRLIFLTSNFTNFVLLKMDADLEDRLIEERLRAELWTTKSVVIIALGVGIGVACIASTATFLLTYQKLFEM